MNGYIRIEPAWGELLDELKSPGPCRIIYVVGAVDRGKTTICHYLEQGLSGLFQTAYIDCDPGQSTLGPPATVGMRIGTGKKKIWSFVGSTSPRGHMLQNLSGIIRLATKAREMKAERIIIDSSGFVLDKPAWEFQYNVIRILQPDVLVFVQKNDELGPVADNFTHSPDIRMFSLQGSRHAIPRTVAERQSYRAASFRAYLADAAVREISTGAMGFHGMIPDNEDDEYRENLLVGLCDSQGFMEVLGVITWSHMQTRTLSVLAPAYNIAGISSIQFGSTRLDTLTWKDY